VITDDSPTTLEGAMDWDDGDGPQLVPVVVDDGGPADRSPRMTLARQRNRGVMQREAAFGTFAPMLREREVISEGCCPRIEIKWGQRHEVDWYEGEKCQMVARPGST